MFGYCETKTSNGKSWNPSPSYAWKVSIVKLLKHKKVPVRNFLVLRAKKPDEDRDPAPFVYLNIFQYQKLSETQKSSSTKRFATGRQTFSKHSRDPATFSFFNIFSIWKIIWNTENSLTNSFGIVKQNSLTENRDTPPIFMHEEFRC